MPLLLFLLVACQTIHSRHVLRGNEFARDGLLKEAVNSYQLALKKDRQNWTAHRNLGLLLVKTGKYDRAIYHLTKSLVRFEKDFDTNFYLGEAYRAKERYSETIFRYRYALNIKPNAPQVLRSLGWTYYQINLLGEAKQVIRKLLTIERRDYNAAIILARIYLKEKNYQRSLDIIRTYGESANKNSLPYFQGIEGDVYLEQGKAKSAASLYFRALRSNPLLPGALIGLGKIFLKNGQNKKAILYLRRAERLQPRHTQVHLLLGEAFETIDVKKSLKHYQAYRRLARKKPVSPQQIALVRDKIKSLRQNR